MAEIIPGPGANGANFPVAPNPSAPAVHPCCVCGDPQASFGYRSAHDRNGAYVWYCFEHRPR